MNTSDDSRPERIYRRDRPIVPFSDPLEKLHRRCLKEHVGSGHLLPAAVSFRNWSVNRGGTDFGEPEDVLIPSWLDWGIASFRVQDVLPKEQLRGGPVYEFRAVHCPDDDNYAHSEIRTYKESQLVSNPDPPNEIKKKFRQMISDKSFITKEPQV